MLPSYCKELQQIGIKLCPWDTMTPSQIRYMKLKSGTLKKFIESQKRGYCAGGHHIVRLLNNGGVKLHHIQIANVMDTSPAGLQAKAAVKIGDQQYGVSSPLGDTSDIQITAVHSRAKNAILLGGSLKDSMISDVLVCDSANEGVVLQTDTVQTAGLFLDNIRIAGKDGTVVSAVSDTFKNE